MDWPEQALVSSAKLHGGYVKCAAHNHSSEQLADHSKVTLELVYRGYYIMSFPDLLWTKPKARSGTVKKFVFLDWPLHLIGLATPFDSCEDFRDKLSSNSSSNLEISAVGEKEKPIRKDERRKDLEVICHSGLNNFRNMIVPLR